MVAVSEIVIYHTTVVCSDFWSLLVQPQTSAGNTGAELCDGILDVLWKETGCDVAVLHLLQKVLVFGQQSEYASCNTIKLLKCLL